MSDDLTEKQRAILEAHKKHPNWSNEEIAVETDSSASYVSQVLNDYDESDLDDGGNGLLILLLILLVGGALVLSGGDSGSSQSILHLALLSPVPKMRWP